MRQDYPDVCVVTHPLAAAGENATRGLLDILGAITGVALVTADLPEDSSIRNEQEVIELTSEGAGESVVVSALRFLLNQLRMCRVILSRPEEVVLFFGATSYLLPIAVARLSGKHVLIEPRGDVPLTLRLEWESRMPRPFARGLAGLVRALERAGYATAHGIITYTPAMAEELGLDPDSTDVFPNGARYVDTDQFAVHTDHEDRENVVGFIGRLDEEKGIRTLALVARELPPEVSFRFVGDGQLREWLESELATEIESGRVTITGWVDHEEVPEELNKLKLLVMPSQPTEGLPTTILEALACGTPVLATPVSGVPDVVRDGDTGFHLHSKNPTHITRRIREVLERDDMTAISVGGRTTIETEYSFEAAMARYRDILNSLLR